MNAMRHDNAATPGNAEGNGRTLSAIPAMDVVHVGGVSLSEGRSRTRGMGLLRADAALESEAVPEGMGLSAVAALLETASARIGCGEFRLEAQVAFSGTGRGEDDGAVVASSGNRRVLVIRDRGSVAVCDVDDDLRDRLGADADSLGRLIGMLDDLESGPPGPR